MRALRAVLRRFHPVEIAPPRAVPARSHRRAHVPAWASRAASHPSERCPPRHAPPAPGRGGAEAPRRAAAALARTDSDESHPCPGDPSRRPGAAHPRLGHGGEGSAGRPLPGSPSPTASAGPRARARRARRCHGPRQAVQPGHAWRRRGPSAGDTRSTRCGIAPWRSGWPQTEAHSACTALRRAPTRPAIAPRPPVSREPSPRPYAAGSAAWHRVPQDGHRPWGNSQCVTSGRRTGSAIP